MSGKVKSDLSDEQKFNLTKDDLVGELWWLRDNDYLITGYRNHLSFYDCMRSLFKIHNELMNVWTHVIGALLFCVLIYVTYAIPVVDIFTTQSGVPKTSHISIEGKPTCRSSLHAYEFMYHYYGDICINDDTRAAVLLNEYDTLFFHLGVQDDLVPVEKVRELEDNQLILSSWLPYASDTYDSLHMTDFMKSALRLLQGISMLVKEYFSGLSKSSSEDTSSPNKIESTLDQMGEDLYAVAHQLVGHVPRWPVVVFCSAAIWCLATSSIYHLCYCLGFVPSNILQTLDYCGISILISGSYVPIVYYSLYCYPTELLVHMIIVFAINAINVSVMATPKFRAPEYRPVRSAAFITVAMYAFIMMIHIWILDGFNNPVFTVAFWYIIGMGVSYITGAVFYSTRVPEKIWPGKFDILFASHQIFHVFIVLAAISHFVASYTLFQVRFSSPCPGY